MTDREKLVELLDYIRYSQEFSCYDLYDMSDAADSIADFLISKGVTVREWIPVTERLPEPNKVVLCIGARGGMFIGYHCQDRERSEDKSMFFYVPNSRNARSAIKWQPLPEPPKEG